MSSLSIWSTPEARFILAAKNANEATNLLFDYFCFPPLVDFREETPIQFRDWQPDSSGIWVDLSFGRVKKLQRIDLITREEAQKIARFEYEEKIKNGEGDMVHKTIQDALIGERFLGHASNGQVYAVRPEVHIPGTGELTVTMGVYYEGIPQPFSLYKETFPLR